MAHWVREGLFMCVLSLEFCDWIISRAFVVGAVPKPQQLLCSI